MCILKKSDQLRHAEPSYERSAMTLCISLKADYQCRAAGAALHTKEAQFAMALVSQRL